jgi:protease IV
MRTAIVGLVLTALVVAAGCGPNAGFIIRPISANEELKETTVSRDPGLFVRDKIVVIDVDGLLMNQRGGGGLFGDHENPVSLFVEKIDKAQDDPDVRALVLRINSPGGGVTASDMMYRRLAQFKKERKVPVIALIEDVGASGAYYLACGCDVILASPTSITGSIGVIVQTFSLAGTLDKLGIAAKAITSGAMKDMGSPLKPFSPADQKVLQDLVTEFYGGFLDVVAAGRKELPRDKIKELADGRIYTGTQAKTLGLVDDLGDIKDALALARKKCGVKAAKVVLYGRPWGYKANVYSAAPTTGGAAELLTLSAPNVMTWFQPQFLYLWTGGAP